MLDVGVHVVGFVLEESGVRMGCDCRCGVECWDDVVLCKSKAEDGVEEEVGRGRGGVWWEMIDFVVDSGAIFVKDFSCCDHGPRGRSTCSVVELCRGALAEQPGGYLGWHVGMCEGVIEFLV